jgi:hypothetical protein
LCGNKRIKKTIEYINSLISIEYLINSFSDLTFFKHTHLNDKQIKALNILPIKPSQIENLNVNDQQIIKKYLTEIANNSSIDKYDNFFISNFKQASL